MRRRTLLSLTAALCTGCIGGRRADGEPSIAAPTVWGQFGRGPQHITEFADGHVTELPRSVKSVRLTGPVVSSPVVDDSRAVVSDSDGIVVVPFADKTPANRVRLPGDAARVPILDEDRIIVTRAGTDTATPAVYSISTAGGVEWRSQLSGQTVQAATLHRGTVYTGTDREFVALDAATGESKWRVSRGMETEDLDSQLIENLSPAVTEQGAIFSTVDGLLALGCADGDVLWEAEGSRINSPPVVRDGRVFAPDFGRGIRSFDGETGEQLWQHDCDGSWATPSVGEQVVFAGYKDGVVALDRASGDLIDDLSDHRYAVSPSGISKIGDTVVTGTTSDSVVSVDWDGQQFVRGSHESRGDGSYAAPTFAGNRLIFAEYDGEDARLVIGSDGW